MKILKVIDIKIPFLIIISAFFYYVFHLNVFNLVSFIAGTILVYISLELENRNIINKKIFLTLVAAFCVFLFYELPLMMATFLIGANLSNYYFQLKDHKTKTHDINLFNIICLSSVIFFAAIQKFRGFNKLILEDVKYTIPLIIIVFIASYFIFRSLYVAYLKHQEKKIPLFLLLSTLIISGVSVAIGYLFYKEIGVFTFALPIFTGLIAALSQLIIKKRNIITDVNEIFMLLVLPYQIAGLMGIGLAFLASYLFYETSILSLNIKSDGYKKTLFMIAPLLFLFASSEIRENEGIISRFNLITGQQAGWLLLATSVLANFANSIQKIEGKLIKEGLEKILATMIMVSFTLIFITLIIKFGKDEAQSSLIVAGSIYLFVLNLLDKEAKAKKALFASAFTNLVGSIAFLLLTRL